MREKKPRTHRAHSFILGETLTTAVLTALSIGEGKHGICSRNKWWTLVSLPLALRLSHSQDPSDPHSQL